MCKLSNLLATLFLLKNASAVLGQLVKGSFGLVTSDPICIQCQNATVQWGGGIPPYVLSVSGYHNSYELTTVGTTQTNQMKWHVNFPAGTRLWFQLLDGNRTDIYTNIVTVGSSVDASCVNVTNPLVTDPSPSATLGPETSSRSAAAESATATSNSNQLFRSHSTTATIAGGIVGGIIALLALLFCLLWLNKRHKQHMTTPSIHKGLDLNEGGYVAEPFTIQAAAGVARIERTPKMRTDTASDLTIQHLDYSSSGISVPTGNDAAPSSSTQPIQNGPTVIGIPQGSAGIGKGPSTGSRTRHNEPVQEQDAGVSLSGGLQSHENATLPPAYDSSWRT